MKFSYQTGARGSRLRYELGYSSKATVSYGLVTVVMCGLLIVPAALSFSTIMPKRKVASTVPQPLPLNEATQPATASTVATNYATPQKPFSAELQAWLKKLPGQYGVFVGSPNGDMYADVQSSRTFSSESIYKLYVAYLGYQQVDAGAVRGDQAYNAGRTRLQCLDAMIRTSDSPCAEKLMGELSKPAIEVKLRAYGLTDTSMRSLKTSARDAAKVLSLIQQGTDLSSDSRNRLLDSLKNQKYRNGLAKGFSDSTVYNKVGFRDLVQYNDVAIVTLADGRVVVVSVMTESAGVRNIARLGAEINRLLKQ